MFVKRCIHWRRCINYYLIRTTMISSIIGRKTNLVYLFIGLILSSSQINYIVGLHETHSTTSVWNRFHKHTYKRSRNVGLLLLLLLNWNGRCRCENLDWDRNVSSFFIVLILSRFISAQIWSSKFCKNTILHLIFCSNRYRTILCLVDFTCMFFCIIQK